MYKFMKFKIDNAFFQILVIYEIHARQASIDQFSLVLKILSNHRALVNPCKLKILWKQVEQINANKKAWKLNKKLVFPKNFRGFSCNKTILRNNYMYAENKMRIMNDYL